MSGRALSSILSIIDSIFISIFKDMENDGFKNSKYEAVKNDNGKTTGFSFTTLTENNHVLHIKALKSAGRSSLYDFYIVGDNGSRKKYLHKPKDQLLDCITEFLEEYYDDPDNVEDFEVAEDDQAARDINLEEGFEQTNSSKKLQVGLSKIQASGEIQLSSVFCNYDELEAYEDLENVLDSPQFSDALLDDVQNFEIIPEQDNYDIKVINEIDSMDCVSRIIRTQFVTLMKMYSLANCPFFCDQNKLFSYISTVRWQLDYMLSSKISGPNIVVKEILDSITQEEAQDVQEDQDIESIIEYYTLVIDLYYTNFPHEIQKLFDEWLLTLRYN